MHDHHSLSRPSEAKVVHAVIDWTCDFEQKCLYGSVTWRVARADGGPSVVTLDTKALTIESVAAGREGALHPVPVDLHPEHPVFGRALVIPLAPGEDHVRVDYRTTSAGSGLQWLSPEQTAERTHPFLFSQAQAIHARTILPCQDSPGVRFTYDATVRVPSALTPLMAARQLGADSDGRTFRFTMPEPIPSYLVAIAVGRVAAADLSPRVRIWAEPSVVEAAAWEFAETEAMIQKAEALYGPYRWERYDILVLPPSFPFGGMENPRLTFATPTVLAKDRSLVALIAHELAHSWSGNLVTNATWSDFWLNEGFTVYFERRILEALYGRARSEMEASLAKNELIDEMKDLDPGDTILKIDLTGRDPDDAFSNVPYEKGYLVLRSLEEAYGREAFDACLRTWFDENAFQSRSTEDFLAHLERTLFVHPPQSEPSVDLHEWIHHAGLPADAPSAQSPEIAEVDRLAAEYVAGRVGPETLPTTKWTTHEWLRFLRALPETTDSAALARLDSTLKITESRNSEIRMQWLLMAIRASYGPAMASLEDFLSSQGRRKFLKPLYTELAKTPEGKTFALSIYRQVRARYHPIAQTTIDGILGFQP